MADRNGVRAGGGIYAALAVRGLGRTDPAPGRFDQRSQARALSPRGIDQRRAGAPASLPAPGIGSGDGPVRSSWRPRPFRRERWPEPVRGVPLASLHGVFDGGEHLRSQDVRRRRDRGRPPAARLRLNAARQLRSGVRRVGVLCDRVGLWQDAAPPCFAWGPPRGPHGRVGGQAAGGDPGRHRRRARANRP